MATEKHTGAMVPLRQLVALPGTTITIDIGRFVSKNGIDLSRSQTGMLQLFTQKDPETEIPMQEELYPIGVLAKITRIEEHPAIDGYKVTVDVLYRLRLVGLKREEGTLMATSERILNSCVLIA